MATYACQDEDHRLLDWDKEDLRSTTTLEKVKDEIFEVVLRDFDEVGIVRFSLDIILGGWLPS